jgi:hypothetical protein
MLLISHPCIVSNDIYEMRQAIHLAAYDHPNERHLVLRPPSLNHNTMLR